MGAFDRRTVAKQLLGKPARLEVASWVLRQPATSWFSLDLADKELPDTQKSEVRECLLLFVELDMLERVTPVPNRPRYRKLESPLWKGFGGFARALDALEVVTKAKSSRGKARRVVDLPRQKRAARASRTSRSG